MLSEAWRPGRPGAVGRQGGSPYSGSCGCRRCAPRCAACWPGRCAACAGTPRGRTAARSAGTPPVKAPPAPGDPRPGPSLPPSLTCSIQALNSCSSAGENGAVRTGLPLLGERPGGRAGPRPSRARTEPSPNRAEPAQASPCQSPPALPVPLYLRPRAPRRRRGPAARPRSAARASPWPGRAEPGRMGRSGAHPG